MKFCNSCLNRQKNCCLFIQTKITSLCRNIKLKKDVFTKKWINSKVEINYITLDGDSIKFNWVLENYGFQGPFNKLTISKNDLVKFYPNGEIIKYHKMTNEIIQNQQYMINLANDNYGNGKKFTWNLIHIEY